MLFDAEVVAGGNIKCEGVREVSAYLIPVLSTALLCIPASIYHGRLRRPPSYFHRRTRSRSSKPWLVSR